MWASNECIPFYKFVDLSIKFGTIWSLDDGVMDFRSWGNLLVQWWGPKWTYNVSSRYMTLKVEFDLSQRRRVEGDILKLILKLGSYLYHKHLGSYGSWKLTFYLGHIQNNLSSFTIKNDFLRKISSWFQHESCL